MTPRVAVDLSRLDANIARYTGLAARANVVLRAHVKGHRTPQIAARQVAAGAVGIAVHSTAEATAYLDHGVTDVVVAWPWADPWRWSRFAQLARRCRVAAHVDRPEVLAAAGAAAVAHNVELGVRIEVDTGLHRVGVQPDLAVPLARTIARTRGLRLDGVTGYAGITDAAQAGERADVGRRQAELLVAVAGEIRADGLPCAVVAVGGTPTMDGALGTPGVTELCSGAYALLDAGLARLNACRPDDVAITVTAAVTGMTAGVLHTDAGELLDGADQPWSPGLVATGLDGTPLDPAGLSVRQRLRLLPGHTCPVVARRPELQVIDGGRVVDRWPTLVLPDRR